MAKRKTVESAATPQPPAPLPDYERGALDVLAMLKDVEREVLDSWRNLTVGDDIAASFLSMSANAGQNFAGSIRSRLEGRVLTMLGDRIRERVKAQDPKP